MSTAGEELEAALQRGWSFDELEVYADHLLANHDPRGDVLALDLSPRPEQPSWVQRRRAAVGAWIGNALAAKAAHLIQHGFLHELRDGMFPLELLDSPAGAYVRGYTTWGRTRVRASLEALAAKPRPWLSRLVIANHADPRSQLPPALVAALIKATPRLEEICIYGNPPFAAFPHPNVRRARLDTRCSAIEIDAVKTRVDVPDGTPGPRIAHDDLELIVELVELAPDCNQLYTHGEQFDEPLPALIARLAAAQLLELDGPVVRYTSPGLPLAPARRAIDRDIPGLPQGRASLYHDRSLQIPDLQAHGNFLRACIHRLPVPPRMYDALDDYTTTWSRSNNTRIPVEADRVARMRVGFNALLELRGLWGDVGIEDDWALVETLTNVLEGRVWFHHSIYGYYWY